jgi:hypothetical protein
MFPTWQRALQNSSLTALQLLIDQIQSLEQGLGALDRPDPAEHAVLADRAFRGTPDSLASRGLRQVETDRVQAGTMLWFTWKTLPGSYSALIEASRS